jgi:N-terminal region of glycosyl transferase group 7
MVWPESAVVYLSFLVGRMNVSNETDGVLSTGELELQHVELAAGGKWAPNSCMPRQNIAVIIPYRDREEHLRALLSILHPMLQRQQLQYTIYVVEQVCWLSLPPFFCQHKEQKAHKLKLTARIHLRTIKMQSSASVCLSGFNHYKNAGEG